MLRTSALLYSGWEIALAVRPQWLAESVSAFPAETISAQGPAAALFIQVLQLRIKD
jgi:hypothetical protein